MAEENLPGPGLAISDKAAQRGGRLRSEKLVQGFTVMHPDKSAAVIGLLDLRPGITPEDFEKALVRTEQGYIRQALLGGRIDAECAGAQHRRVFRRRLYCKITPCPSPPATDYGPYEVLSLLGKGGIGEVCRAQKFWISRARPPPWLPKEFAEIVSGWSATRKLARNCVMGSLI